MYRMTATFANSDGWKLTAPKRNQRLAPAVSLPICGIKTITSRDTAINITGLESLFSLAMSIDMAKNIMTRPMARYMRCRLRK